MIYLQTLMDQDIKEVQDVDQLRTWISEMCNSSNAIYTILSSTPHTIHFTYEHQTLSITDVVNEIAEKIDVLVGMYPRIGIEKLKQIFVFDEVQESRLQTLSLAQLVANLQTLNDTPCCFH